MSLVSRKGDTTLRALTREQIQPGILHSTFHLPETGANTVTTEIIDWANRCPEYKVTAVEMTFGPRLILARFLTIREDSPNSVGLKPSPVNSFQGCRFGSW